MKSKHGWSCVTILLFSVLCGGSASAKDGFDPKTFLCDFSGASPIYRGTPIPGRRFTPDERARARELIAREFARLGYTAGLQQYVSKRHQGTNVYVELPATVPSDEWIVVAAHYDSVKEGPGADDDASGVTAVIMIARELVRMPRRAANVLFLFFDQEEEGTVGSEQFAARLGGRHVSEAHCIDMVGNDADGDRVVEVGHTENPVPGTGDMFMRLYEEAATRLGRPAGSVHRTDMDRSDHESFIAHGIPAVILSEEFVGGDASPNYHQQSDTCEAIDFGFLVATADLVAEALKLRLR